MSARSINSTVRKYETKKIAQNLFGDTRDNSDQHFDPFSTKHAEEGDSQYQIVLTINLDLPAHSLADMGNKIACNSKRLLQVFEIAQSSQPIFTKEFEIHLHHGMLSPTKK